MNKSTILSAVKKQLGYPDGAGNITAAEVQSAAREILTDTIEAYRWSDAQLAGFVNDGIRDIRERRYDARFNADGTERTATEVDSTFAGEIDLHNTYKLPLTHYTVFRAFELDADDQSNNAGLSEAELKLYVEGTGNAPYNYLDDDLTEWLVDSLRTIKELRPEFFLNDDFEVDDEEMVFDTDDDEIILPDRLQKAIVFYMCYRALQSHGEDKGAESKLTYFNAEMSR